MEGRGCVLNRNQLYARAVVDDDDTAAIVVEGNRFEVLIVPYATAVLENPQHVDAFFLDGVQEEVVEIFRTSCISEVNAAFFVVVVNQHVVKAFLPSGEVLFYYLLLFFVVKDVVIGNFLEHIVVKGKYFHSFSFEVLWFSVKMSVLF